jgi:hypothetical protein
MTTPDGITNNMATLLYNPDYNSNDNPHVNPDCNPNDNQITTPDDNPVGQR